MRKVRETHSSLFLERSTGRLQISARSSANQEETHVVRLRRAGAEGKGGRTLKQE